MESGRPATLAVLGGTGFVGRHLVTASLAAGIATVATRYREASVLPETGLLALETVDVRDRRAVRAFLRRWEPRWVVVLAAQSSVAAAEADKQLAFDVNVRGAWNVFVAARSQRRLEKIVWVGSGEAYGVMPEEVAALDENQPLEPVTAYGASKAAADWLAMQQARVHGTPIVRARLFPCTGPGQSARFVCSDFARQIAMAERRGRPVEIVGGNLHVVRDYTDVRDVAVALLALLQSGRVGEAYNVCSGVGRTILEVAHSLLGVAGLKGTVRSDARKQRTVDIPRLIGSPKKITAATGWQPRRTFEQTLRDLLEDWRRRVQLS